MGISNSGFLQLLKLPFTKPIPWQGRFRAGAKREQILQNSESETDDLFKSSPQNEGQVQRMPMPLDEMPQE